MALASGGARARLDLHGALVVDGRAELAPDVAALAEADAVGAVGDDGTPLVALRATVARSLRRAVTLRREDAITAAGAVIARLVDGGRLARDGDTIRRPGTVAPAPDPALTAAMDRLETALAVPAPPPLGEAALAAGCPPDGIRALERTARIVVLEPDLAYAMSTYRDLAAAALRLAAREPLTPATFRDATGTSRKFVLAILEDLDRRAILRRTPAGHVPGPRAPGATASDASAGGSAPAGPREPARPRA